MPSDKFLNTAFDRNSQDPFITLIRAEIDGVFYYYAQDNQGHTSTVSGSPQFYQRAAFTIKLPDDTAEGTPTATIDFDAADIQIVRMLRSAEEKIGITVWVVLASDVNVIEYGPSSYESDDVSISSTAVSLQLSAEPILDIQYPGYRYTPELFPSLWRDQFE